MTSIYTLGSASSDPISVFDTCFVDKTNNRIVMTWRASFAPNTWEETFGFHTKYTCPIRTRKIVLKIAPDERHLWDGERIKSLKASRLAMQLKWSAEEALVVNLLNIAGYIPFVGLIPFAVRVLMPLIDENSSMWLEPTDVTMAHFVRGTLEGLGVGIVYLIPDIIATVKRFS